MGLIRDRVEPAAGLAMSVVAPKAEVIQGLKLHIAPSC